MSKRAWISAICLGPSCWLMVAMMALAIGNGAVAIRKHAFSNEAAREALSHANSMIMMNRRRVRLWL
jgi:hypothetical protein